MTSIPSLPLRPSALPKLAECPRYVGSSDAGPAAARGTAMDAAFRAILTGSHVGWAPDANKEDCAAVEWAVASFKMLAGNAPIQADENDLRVEMLGMEGTADGACPEKLFGVDLKSGQVRNYEEQMAAYALGFMEREFCDEWTMHLLFCDERQIVTHKFTMAGALAIVQPILLAVKDGLSKANPCDYCGWCARRWECEARLEPMSILLMGAPDKLDLNAIKSCPADLARVMNITYQIQKDDGLHDELKTAALEHLLKNTEVPGWGLQKGRETKTVPAATIAEPQSGKTLLNDAGAVKVLSIVGNITGAKYAALWAETYPGVPVPEGAIQTNHGAAFVAKSRKKATK